MKKALLLVVCGLLLLFVITSCGINNDDTKVQTEFIAVSDATEVEHINKVISKVKEGYYDNIIGDEIRTDVKTTDKLDVICWNIEPDIDETIKELYSLYYILLGKEADEQMLCFNSFDDISGCDCDTDLYDGMHKLSLHRTELDNGSISTNEIDLIDNNNGIIVCCPTNHLGGLFVKMDKHAGKLLPSDLHFSYWMPTLDEYSEFDSEINIEKDGERIISYVDGGCSVKESIKNMQSDLNNLCPDNSKFNLRVSKPNVFNYCGSEMLSCALDTYYNNIRFEAIPNGTASASQYIDEDKDLCFEIMPTAVSAYQGNICFYIGNIPRAHMTVYETIDTAISPDDALSAVSNKLTAETTFQLDEISLCYINDSKHSSPSYPYWRFNLKNTINGEIVIAYVGCKDGEIYIVPL